LSLPTLLFSTFSLVLLLIPPPPSSTLFPYTTLFRSRGISHLTVARSKDGRTGWVVEGKPLIADDPTDAHSCWGVEDARITYVEEDRKSTRLNSSHSQISYAVFCLKKKKKKNKTYS